MEERLPINNNYYEEDEIDLKELLMVLVKEKKTIAITFITIFLMALGGAFYVRNTGKEALAIVKLNFKSVEEGVTPDGRKITNDSLIPLNVIQRVYSKEKVGEKTKLSLDEFRNKFQVTGIVPTPIENQKSILAKKGETLDYTPNSYKVQLRVGDIDYSRNVLKQYFYELNKEYSDRYVPKYKFDKIDKGIIVVDSYDYQDYLDIINKNIEYVSKAITPALQEKTDFISYGYGYRNLNILLENLKNGRVNELDNYLEYTGIVKDTERFNRKFKTERDNLVQEIELKTKTAKGYKLLLDEFQKDEQIMKVPKGIKIDMENSEIDTYYTTLVDNYLKTQLEIENLKENLNKIDLKKTKLNKGSEESRHYIDESLNKIIDEFNIIVDRANELESISVKIDKGGMIVLASPITVISHGKALMILGAGVVLGLIMGVVMAFVNNFFKGFKGTLAVIGVFFLFGVNGYSEELKDNEVMINFLHKEISQAQNPNKTPFLAESEILDFLKNEVKLTKNESSNISIQAIFPGNSHNIVEGKIKSGANYIYIPTEYKIVVNTGNKERDNEIVTALKNDFSDYFINKNLKIHQVFPEDFDYESYRVKIESIENYIEEMKRELNFRISQKELEGIKKEFNALMVKIDEFEAIDLKNFVNFVESNGFVSNLELEKSLLKGKVDILTRENKHLENKKSIYKQILKDYRGEKREAILLDNGDITLTNGTNIREKQYIKLSGEYMGIEQKIIKNSTELEKDIKMMESLREPNEKEKEEIDRGFQYIIERLMQLRGEMLSIASQDYRDEYFDSVRVR